MRAVWVVFWAQLRHRWRSWLAIAVLISLVGGVVMAAVSAGRRTESAFPAFVAAKGFDAEMYSVQPLTKVSRLPGVIAVTEAFGPDNGQPTCACTHPLNPSYFGVVALPGTARPDFNLVSGRLPDPSNPDEVVASYTLEQDEGVHLGSIIRVPFYASSQQSAYDSTTGAPPAPTGPTVALRVVGFEATEFDFPPAPLPSTTSTPLRASSALCCHERRPATCTSCACATAPLTSPGSTRPLSRGRRDPLTQNEDSQVASVEASIHPQAIGWWLLAPLAALVGLAVIGQALGRQSIAESEDFSTMVALGIERRQLVMLSSARNLVVGLSGALGALVIATILSPIAPLGEARIAETSTGIRFDPLVLVVGAVAIPLVVMVLGFWPALRAARASRSRDRIVEVTPSKVAGRLWKVGAPPSVVIGVRNALGTEERRGQRACGQCPAGHRAGGDRTVWDSGVRRQSLAPHGHAHTVRGPLPAQYLGPQQRRDARSGPLEGPRTRPGRHWDHPGDRPTGRLGEQGGRRGHCRAGRARSAPPLDGSRAPPTDTGEVGLGATTMRQVGARLGSIVQVTMSLPSGGSRTVPFRVVAQMSLPVLGNAVSLGTGAHRVGRVRGGGVPRGSQPIRLSTACVGVE